MLCLCCESRWADSLLLHKSANLCPSKTSIKCYYSTFSPNFPSLCKHRQKGNTLVGKYYAFDNTNIFLIRWKKSSLSKAWKIAIGIYELKHVSLKAWQRTNTFSYGEKGTQQRRARRHIFKEQGMHMLSQAKTGQQEEAQGRSAHESNSPENAFDSQQAWRRRRRYLLCCGSSQGEVISSCFKDFCHQVSAHLHDKFVYGYWKKRKKPQTWHHSMRRQH